MTDVTERVICITLGVKSERAVAYACTFARWILLCVNKSRSNGLSTEAHRPIVIGFNEYPDYDAAAEELVRPFAEPQMLRRLFLPEVMGGLVVADGVELLMLRSKDRMGMVPRNTGFRQTTGVSVSGYRGQDVDVAVRVSGPEDHIIERGLAWVRVGKDVPPVLMFSVLPRHDVERPDRLAPILRAVENKSVALIDGVLRSDPRPPYAHNSLS